MHCRFNDLFYVSDFVLIYTHFKSSLFEITRYTRTWVSEVCVLNNWSYLYKALATLTTIATPRSSEGVEMSDDVGRLLGPLFIVIRAKRVSNWYIPQKKSARVPVCSCAVCTYVCTCVRLIILVLVCGIVYHILTYLVSARYQPATKIRICRYVCARVGYVLGATYSEVCTSTGVSTFVCTWYQPAPKIRICRYVCTSCWNYLKIIQ